MAVLGPVSAVVVQEMVRSRVSAAELREALRRLRHGEMDDFQSYAGLDGRTRRVVDLVGTAERADARA
ncbi:hypothetical protein D3218_08820 [Aureimonas flava]|uniref:Uncharacterized protein n=1 Tax=Aureimonas flava TaxID=2320271 RepID=A0A3A1WT73_9HYPH|nr:hypothetical protein D3218_08820 [Aureimonas flava]